MYKQPNTFKVDDGEEIDLDDDSQEIIVKDGKGPSKLTFNLADETDSKTSAPEPPSSATNLEKLSEISKQAEKTASAMVVTAESLLDMIEFTKALTQYDSVPEVPRTDSTDENFATRPKKSTESCSCACHPEETDSLDGEDHEEGDCRCKAPSHATFKTAKKTPGSDTKTKPPTDGVETSIVIQSSSSNAGEQPLIVVAHPPESHMGPIALYPTHECSAQCHCYLRHIAQGPPLEVITAAVKENHEAKKCSDDCRCSCHKEIETVITFECNHQCLLHCGPAPEPEEEEKVASESGVINLIPPTDSEDSKRRSSIRDSITKLGSKIKPTSVTKRSTSGAAPFGQLPGVSMMSEMKMGSQLKPASMVGGSTSAGVAPEDATEPMQPVEDSRPSRRSTGKGSIFARLSKSLRGSK